MGSSEARPDWPRRELLLAAGSLVSGSAILAGSLALRLAGRIPGGTFVALVLLSAELLAIGAVVCLGMRSKRSPAALGRGAAR